MQTILLVDDDPSAIAIVAHTLQRPHRTIEVAAHGVEAIERIASHKPDLLITDVMMPRMNGWSLVRRLRSTPTTAFIPVIFMTALDAPSSRIRGFHIGADDYVTKPVKLDELERRIENVLFRARGAHSGGLTGDLAQFGLSTPLTILELEHKTGLLAVDCPPNHALLVIKEGRVVRAELTDRVDCSVVDCVCEILGWETGRFSFSEQTVHASTDGRPTTALLLDAARMLDELIPVD